MSAQGLHDFYNKWHGKDCIDITTIDQRDIKYCNWILYDLLEINPNKILLDISCGKGLFLFVASKKHLTCVGIDISSSAVRCAKNVVPDTWLVCGNAEKLPFPDETFDYITCNGSLEHFPHPDIGASEISRVLKKGGIACITVPNLFFVGHIYMAWRYGIEPDEAEQQFSEIFMTRQGWTKLLEENGLKVVRCYKYNTIWASKKVGSMTKIAWNILLKPFIPLNLSYMFIFICKKDLK